MMPARRIVSASDFSLGKLAHGIPLLVGDSGDVSTGREKNVLKGAFSPHS
jgi:hypothetical protein